MVVDVSPRYQRFQGTRTSATVPQGISASFDEVNGEGRNTYLLRIDQLMHHYAGDLSASGNIQVDDLDLRCKYKPVAQSTEREIELFAKGCACIGRIEPTNRIYDHSPKRHVWTHSGLNIGALVASKSHRCKPIIQNASS